MKKIFLSLMVIFLAVSAVAETDGFPMIFCQAQLKYPIASGAGMVRYYSNWVDSPLLVSSRFPAGGKGLSAEEFKFMRTIAQKYGFSGFMFWQGMIRTKRRSDFLTMAEVEPLAGFRMVPIISRPGGVAGFDVDSDPQRLLNSPAVMEIDGKKLFWTYNVPDDKLLKKLADGIRKHGKNFMVVQSSSFPAEIKSAGLDANGELPPESAERVRERVRAALKLFDGFAWSGMSTNSFLDEKGERVFNTPMAKAILKVTAEVFKEPEFKNKLFGGAAVAEHSNAGRLGGTLTSDGTRALRESVLTALDAGAKIINIPEWDEQNENTSLRPTVYNSFAYMRILRYIMLSRRGESEFFLPGDDLRVPNLIVSARKILTLGEIMNVELLNIPDRTGDRGEMDVTLRVCDVKGNVLYTAPVQNFDLSKMCERRIFIPSEKFAGQRVVTLHLTVERDGKKEIFTGGLPAVQLQATWNNDYKYSKLPLRDLAAAPQMSFTVTPASEAGVATMSAQISSPEMLRFVEVVENGDVIYTAGNDNNGVKRENSDDYAFRVNVSSPDRVSLSGTISVSGAQAKWLSGAADGVKHYRNTKISPFFTDDFLTIPKSADAAAVVLQCRFGGFQKDLLLADLLKARTVILPLGRGIQLAITRQMRQLRHPADLLKKELSFSVPVMPDRKVSVFQVRLITTDGKLFSGTPVVYGDPGKKTVKAVVFSETRKKPVALTLPENFVPEIVYGAQESIGIEEPVEFGRPYWGSRGGFYNLATLRLGGGGSCSNGCSAGLTLGNKIWGKIDRTPDKTQLDGKTVYTFTDGQHLALPQGVIPRRAGFTVSFDILPAELGREQFILGCRREYVGVLSEVTLLKDGRLYLHYAGARRMSDFVTKGKLRPGVWNTVVIKCDLKQITVTINGKANAPAKIHAPGLYDMPTTVGTWELKRAFKGQIRNLKFSHRAD